MKVGQLIAELNKMPPDAEVSHLWDGALRTSIEVVYLAKNGEVVTADYSQVCYRTEERPIAAPAADENKYWETRENPRDDGDDLN